ncbi:MAG: hypothetical protein WA432_00650 [Candidatus Babeliaceae bacterium]
MKKITLEKITHCCQLMDISLNDPKTPLKYYPIVREYGFIMNDSFAIQLLNYCPWCSIKLPESVRDYYFEIMWARGLEPGFDKYNDPNIPEEFKSDEWWKKRGL